MSQNKGCGSCGGCPPPQNPSVPPPPPMAPPAAPQVKITPEELQELAAMQERCYRLLHRPMVVKVDGHEEEIFYICQKDLDRWMKKHEHLNPIITGFKR